MRAVLGRLSASLEASLAVVLAAAMLLYAAWPWLPGVGQRPPRTIVFYGFSILGEAMTEAVFPAFEKHWREKTGEEIAFASAFAGSGTVTNQVMLGVPADLVLLSLELDAQRLAAAGVVAPDAWKQLPQEGVLNRTPFVILVREGNPKGIHGFEDLAKPGVGVVHPDPTTSGGANWAIVAEYGAGERQRPGGGGRDLLRGIWSNVTAQASSARAARTQFENGFGDALVTYEQDVVRDRAKGKLKGEVVYPPVTVLSEHTLVVVERNVRPNDRELVDELVRYLWSREAQELFAEYGFRSVLPNVSDETLHLAKITSPLLIKDFGGWKRAKAEIVDATWRDGVMKELKR